MFSRKHLFEQPKLFSTPIFPIEDFPDFPDLLLQEKMVWDLRTQRTATIHPLSFFRRYLNEFSVKTIESCRRMISISEQKIFVRVSGLVILKQRPPTANGVMFITLEDETGIVNVIVWRNLFERFRRAVISGRLLRITGRLQRGSAVTHVLAEKIEGDIRKNVVVVVRRELIVGKL